MKNIYKAIWVDGIVNIKKNPKHKNDWKFFSMVYMTLLNALNLAVLLIILSYYYDVKVLLVRITIFPGTMLNSFVSFLILFALPFGLINYFIIFYRNKYEKLIQVYSEKKGKLFASYLLGSIVLFVLSIVIYILQI